MSCDTDGFPAEVPGLLHEEACQALGKWKIS